MSGRSGNVRYTSQNLEVVRIDAEKNLLRILPGFRPMSHTTTNKNRSTTAAMPRTASTFLTINLCRRPIHLRAPLCLMRPLTSIRQLPHQRLMHQITINFRFKNAGWKLDAANLFTSHVINWNFHHQASTNSSPHPE
jgi:hypothetical protein